MVGVEGVFESFDWVDVVFGEYVVVGYQVVGCGVWIVVVEGQVFGVC